MLSQPLLRFVAVCLWFSIFLPWLGIVATTAPFLSQLGAGVLCACALLSWNWCLEPLTTLSSASTTSATVLWSIPYIRASANVVTFSSPALLMLALPLFTPFTLVAGLAGLLVGTLFITGSLLLVELVTS